MSTILCTIGTSIANGCPELARFQKQGSAWAYDNQQLAGEITGRLQRFDLSAAAGRIAASAELNSLHRLKLREGDEVVLLATDTADGHACGDALALVLKKHWPGVHVILERVEGLQVRDAERLRKTGLVRLMQVVLRYVEDPQRQYGGGLVINPTGGFKGVVPFLTVIGMIFRVPTVYVFEFSDTLIHLPPLPINFDLHLFQRARPALAELRRQEVMPESHFYRLIRGFSPEERPLFQSLLETDEANNATLSPLALTLAELEAAPGSSVWLSPQAGEKLATAHGEERKRLEAILTRFSNPLWRNLQAHPFNNCELSVFGNSRLMFRLAAIFRDGRAHVCRLYNQHDEYERGLAGLKLRDFPSFDNFQEWTPPQTLDDLDLEETTELERLRLDVAAFPSVTAQKLQPLKEELARLTAATKDKSTRIGELETKLAATEAQVKSLHQQAQRPPATLGLRSETHAAQSSAVEQRFQAAESDSATASLRGLLVDATLLRERRKPSGNGSLFFSFTVGDRTYEGWLSISMAAPLGPLPIGSQVRLKIAGTEGPTLPLMIP